MFAFQKDEGVERQISVGVQTAVLPIISGL